MSSTQTKRATSWSVIVGTLLVPLSAVAALVMADPGESAATTTTSTTTVAAQAPSTTAVLAGTDDSPEDLATACGVEGMDLVALEEDGAITPVQQAALDALREICAQEDMPLPGKPAPEPVIETVVVEAGPSATTPPPASTTVTTVDDYDDDHEDDDYEDEDEDDHDDDHDDDDDHGDDD